MLPLQHTPTGTGAPVLTLGSLPIHAQQEVLGLNSGFCSHAIINEMREIIILHFAEPLWKCGKMFGVFHILMLQNFFSCCNSSWPLLLKLQVEEKFCKDPIVWEELIKL